MKEVIVGLIFGLILGIGMNYINRINIPKSTNIDCIDMLCSKDCFGSYKCISSNNLYNCGKCIGCSYLSDCWECIGLEKKQYCFRNIQLTKEEYFEAIKGTI